MKIKKNKNSHCDSIDEKKTPIKNNNKKHKKRNSDFCGSEKTVGHRRRRSDGVV